MDESAETNELRQLIHDILESLIYGWNAEEYAEWLYETGLDERLAKLGIEVEI